MAVRRIPLKAFTLIELLVVIAVIAVLLAILLPSLARVREAGRRAKCMGQMRQIQIAWHAYATDYGDHIVLGRAYGDNWTAATVEKHGNPWLGMFSGGVPQRQVGCDTVMRKGALAPYVGNVHTYLCPSRDTGPGQAAPGYRWLGSYSIAASMNGLLLEERTSLEGWIRENYDMGRTVPYVRKTSELLDPGPASRMVLMDRGYGYWGNTPPCVYVVWGWGLPSNDGTDLGWAAPIHHANGTNVSFADGHIEYWQWLDPKVLAWARHWRDAVILGPPSPGGRTPQVSPTPDAPAPDPNNPDHVRVFRAVWGKWPASP
jgi:prepilin-type N-terminal cleavage/methylation domain-containing protein/prepilin-type processing-associated H-X9-DG protein